MGKASRVRNAKLAVAEIKREQLLAQEKEAKRQKKVRIITAVVSTFLAVVFIVSLVLLNWVQASGTLLRSKTAMKTDDLSVSGTTFNYFYNYQYQNFVNNNSSYLSYYGLDTTTTLRAQTYSEEQTWFDYFLSQTQKNLNEILILAQQAKNEGITLTDDDKAQIEDFFKTLKEAAEESDTDYEDYMALAYGKGVKEEDIRKGLELSLLSTRYYTEKIDSVEYTDKDITDYFNKNKNDFLFVDFKTYTFNPNATDGMTDKEKEAEYDKVNKFAERLAKAKNADEFDSILTAILKEKDTTEENIKTAISDTVSTKNTYDESFAVSKWAFDEGAKVNETYVYKNSNSRTVYMLTKAPYRDESETRSVRHILVSKDSYETDADAKKKAEEILAEYNKGEKTAEAFGKLAEKYTEDPGSKTTGGLYAEFTEGTMVEAFEKWSFDSKRKEGDTEIVKTDYGYHVMYYVGKGRAQWQTSVEATIKDNNYTEMFEELEKKIKVTSDTKVMNDVNEIVLYTSTSNS